MALSKPVDIRRHKQFKKDVDDLKRAGIIRHYTAEISKKTDESTGNISNYYNGVTPIGNKFLKKFKKAYGYKLKKLREINGPKGDLPLAADIETPPPPPTDISGLPDDTDKNPDTLAEPDQDTVEFRQTILKRLAQHDETIKKLEKVLSQIQQLLDKLQKPPGKKK